MEPTLNTYLGTGRRKRSVARVKVLKGSGRVSVNERTLDEFFGGLERHKKQAMRPLAVFPSANNFDFSVRVEGGGITGQAGAISMGIARAILSLDETMRKALRQEGLLTRDSREVERKKPGKPKARKRFQFSKR
ncbi:MAG: 30S ribosomal protein S9 [Endomicrobiales bacterium]|nr:30S ribosomal protein S9 [Endomicrobiales bacterium]